MFVWGCNCASCHHDVKGLTVDPNISARPWGVNCKLTSLHIPSISKSLLSWSYKKSNLSFESLTVDIYNIIIDHNYCKFTFALPQFQIHVNCESWWSKRLKSNWCQDIFFWRWVAVKYWDPVKSLLTCFLDNDYFHLGLSFDQKCKKYTSANFLVFRDCPEDNLWSLHCLYQIKCALTISKRRENLPPHPCIIISDHGRMLFFHDLRFLE